MTIAQAPVRPTYCLGQCGEALRHPAHHDRLLTVDTNIDVLLELLEIAVTWYELDYSAASVVGPENWSSFADEHTWTVPTRAHRAFSLAVDIAGRRAVGMPPEMPLADVIDLVRS
jgi:hypothetical protein